MMSNRSVRVLSLATAFVGGCVVVILYQPSLKQGETGQIAERQTLSETVQRMNWQSSSSGGAVNSRDDGRRQSDLLHAPRPSFTLPKVNDSLPKASFGDNWKIDPNVSHLRLHGLTSNLPNDETLRSFPVEKLSAIYHSFLDNSDVICHRKLRMGNMADGGWEICDDYEWRPIPPCIIYSFGINNDFSFDDHAGRIYGCDVYAFDPSMKQKTYRRSDRVMFYSIGIGGTSGAVSPDKRGWKLHSFSNIKQMLQHTDKVIDVVKMDVEQSEWPALSAMVREGQLTNVRQLLVEFHMGRDAQGILLSHLNLLKDLERIGFRKFYVSKNFHCQRKALAFPLQRTSCYEVHYVNVNFQRGS